ncbi:CsgG/HfaB family protein [Gracilinema caldarium]|uniref:CsgG/HfaB family protein n=1 Tax=Gracilinema caldarium TaxID=215591 RepID=UPI0026EB5AA0|nr:CsgG/HfaB family protein [Gracilinema caldarium]
MNKPGKLPKTLLVLIFPLLAVDLWAAPVRIAVSDFNVVSDNPKLKYIGKGLSEMIAVDLAAAKTIQLIEREKRDEILAEMEFSLSGIADESSLLKAGQLLAAGYILFGEIIDMDSTVLVSCKLVNAETSEITWQDKYTGPLSDYDSISRKLAHSALVGLGFSEAVAAQPIQKAKPAVSSEQKVKAILAFSNAVDAFDKKDSETAKQQLSVIKAIDPQNPAVLAYLAKLTPNTAKFKILMDSYMSYQNPAYLGIIKQDSFHFAVSMPVIPVYYMPLIEGINYTNYGENRYITETVTVNQFGYAFPLSQNMGLRLNIQMDDLDVRTTVGSPPINNYNGGLWDDQYARGAWGANMDLGIRLGTNAAFGIGGAIYLRSDTDTNPVAPFIKNSGTTWSINGGFLVKTSDDSIIFDSRIGYIAETQELVDYDTFLMTGETRPFPLAIENNLTFSLAGKKLFIAIKNVDNIALDTMLISSTLMPAFEYFIFDWLSLRTGIEGALLVSNKNPETGFGGMAGFTIRIIPWGTDIDLNLAYRNRPSSAVVGYLYPDFLFLLNINRNGLVKKSR